MEAEEEVTGGPHTPGQNSMLPLVSLLFGIGIDIPVYYKV